MTRLTPELLQRWRSDPAAFIEEVLFDPATNRPFQLLPAERAFLEHAFKTDADGRLLYSDLIYSAPKKSGKTTLAALFLLALILLMGPDDAEAYVIASDLEQAQARTFEMCKRIIRASPLLRGEVKMLAERITFRHGPQIVVLASDYASAAGAAPTISTFDEIWGSTSERSRRLFDEMIPVPVRKISCRLVTSYAGFTGESELLEELYKRGLEQPQIGPDLYAGDGLLMFWTHNCVAPWQDERWLNQMRRSLRPNQFQRMIQNRFVTSDSPLLDLSYFDNAVNVDYVPPLFDHDLPIWIGIDASVRHDSSALAAVSWDKKEQRCRLIAHKIFTPLPNRGIDFQNMIENTVHIWKGRFKIRACYFDPYQMVASAQRLTREGVKMIELPQSLGNLTEASSCLVELIKSRRFLMYQDAEIRRSMARAVLIESGRGQRIGKVTGAHRIDVIAAISFAVLACTRASIRVPLRAYVPLGADGFGQLQEIDPQTGYPIDRDPPVRIRQVHMTETEAPTAVGFS